MLNTIFLLVSLYTISGKQAVASGDIPEGATCEYVQSGNKSGQMTAGNDLTLTMNGYEGMTLRSITLEMKSNKSSGAGELQLKYGESVVWSIADASFEDASWAGTFSTEWVDISHSLNVFVSQEKPIELYIKASENSLYLQSVKLSYTAPQATTYTVSFDTHGAPSVASITEEAANSGVELPDLRLSGSEWQFVGWTSQPVEATSTEPVIYYPGTIYYPTGDCTLHAVYVSMSEVQPWYPTDDLTLEDYVVGLYVKDARAIYIARGEVTNGMIPTVLHSIASDDSWVSLPNSWGNDADAVYTLGVQNDTLTIRHKKTNTAVVLAANGKFAKTSSSGAKWIVHPVETEADEMPRFAVTADYAGKTYYISYTVAGQVVTVYLYPSTDANQYHELVLFALSEMDKPTYTYTSYLSPDAIDQTSAEQTSAEGMPQYEMHVGPYKMIIQNGKKYLQINE